MLDNICQALASIQTLTVTNCELAFNCELHRDDNDLRRHWGTSPEIGIEKIDVRIGETGGIVLAMFDLELQADLVKELHALGQPEDLDIVSPPVATGQTVQWQRKWSVGYTLFGVKIYFGLEEANGRERLINASRNFTL